MYLMLKINTRTNHSQQDPICLTVLSQNLEAKHRKYLEDKFLAASYIRDKDYMDLTKDCQVSMILKYCFSFSYYLMNIQ